MAFVETIQSGAVDVPSRWYNVLPDLPRLPDDLLDPQTGEPITTAYAERLLPPAIAAQDRSLERWISIPESVRDAYRLWRPTPLMRATAFEESLGTDTRIYFKYEGGSMTGSHKLNSAFAQAYYAKQAGVRTLVTDTGAGQWGSALALACRLMGVETRVFMVRASYFDKPYRRYYMETLGAKVQPSPGEGTAFGRALLAERPDHPGSEATAASEALEVVWGDEDSRFSMGAFANYVLLHQTVIGLEAKGQLESIDVEPDCIVASVGCGSNMGGIALPWIPDIYAGMPLQIVAAEPDACATLLKGEYRYDYADASGKAPIVKTYTLGHEFVPPPIHAGGLRYHGAAPLVGLLRHEGLIQPRAYRQTEIFEAACQWTRLTGFLPAPETAHAIRAVIDLATTTPSSVRPKTILFCFSGNGMLDLGAYGRYLEGSITDYEDDMADDGLVAERVLQEVGPPR